MKTNKHQKTTKPQKKVDQSSALKKFIDSRTHTNPDLEICLHCGGVIWDLVGWKRCGDCFRS